MCTCDWEVSHQIAFKMSRRYFLEKFNGGFFRSSLSLDPNVEVRIEEVLRENRTNPALKYSMWFTVFSVFLCFFLIHLLGGVEVLNDSWNISLTFLLSGLVTRL